MALPALARFAGWTLALVTVVFVVAAVGSPPDPLTQLRYAAVGVPLAGLVAYLLVYRGGEAWIRRTVGEE